MSAMRAWSIRQDIMSKKTSRPGPVLRQFSAFEMDDDARRRAAQALQEYVADQRAEPDAPGGKPRTKAEKRRRQEQEKHLTHRASIEPADERKGEGLQR
jgi:hypothetical protein